MSHTAPAQPCDPASEAWNEWSHQGPEITLLHRAGLGIQAALLAATAGGAELCDVDSRHPRLADMASSAIMSLIR